MTVQPLLRLVQGIRSNLQHNRIEQNRRASNHSILGTIATAGYCRLVVRLFLVFLLSATEEERKPKGKQRGSDR